MSAAQHGQTRCLVAATRLDTDETVLNNVNAANTVTAGDGVGSQEDVDGVSDSLLLATLSELKLHGNTLLEGESEVLGLIGSRQRVLGQLPHVGRRSGIRVLQDTSLVRAVGEVLVHAPGLGLGGRDGDALLLGIGEEVVAASETLVEDGVAPWGNDLDLGLQGVEGKLEADLVVTLASAAVGDREAALALGHGNLGTGNDRTSQGGPEQVNILVDSIASNGGEAELLDELPAEIDNLALESTDLHGLLASSLEVLC